MTNHIAKPQLLISFVALSCASGLSAQTTFNGGALDDPGNWSAGLPAAGNDGTINVDGTLGTGNMQTPTFSGATINVGGGAVLDLDEDLFTQGATWIFGNATINAADDIFSATGTVTLNAGSVANVGDDLQAQGGGTLNINGGTHAVSGPGQALFGAQGGDTLNFLGGSVTSEFFETRGGSFSTIGGSATASAGAFGSLHNSNSLNFLPNWTGSLTVVGASWETQLVGAASLDGVLIDSTSFAANFDVTGSTLSLIAPIPEPSMFAVILGSLGLIVAVTRRGRG